MYLVGIDVGTTNTKTVIFDIETGRICAVGSSRTITRHPLPEWSEFDAEDVWGTVLQSIQAAVQHCDRPERIRAISVASMGESAFPMDSDTTDARAGDTGIGPGWHCVDTARTDADRGGRLWPERIGAHRSTTCHLYQQ